MKAARQAAETPGSRDGEAKGQSSSSPSDILSSLTGREANRERTVAYRTRRVVLSSLGVLKEQKQDRRRARGVAVAVTLVVLLLIAPLVWEFSETMLAGEHFGDAGSQLSIWACIVCTALLAAALVAGWLRNRS